MHRNSSIWDSQADLLAFVPIVCCILLFVCLFYFGSVLNPDNPIIRGLKTIQIKFAVLAIVWFSVALALVGHNFREETNRSAWWLAVPYWMWPGYVAAGVYVLFGRWEVSLCCGIPTTLFLLIRYITL